MTKKISKENPARDEETDIVLPEKESQEIDDDVEAIVGEFVEESQAKELSVRLRQYFFNLVPRDEVLDAERMQMVTSTIEKQESYRFQYLMKQAEIEAETKRNEDARKDKELTIKEKQYENNFSITKPAVYLVLILTAGLIIFSAYLIIIGEKDVGITLLVGITTAVLGFLAGRGITLYQQKE